MGGIGTWLRELSEELERERGGGANRGGPMTGLLGLSFPRLRRRERPFDFSLVLSSFSMLSTEEECESEW